MCEASADGWREFFAERLLSARQGRAFWSGVMKSVQALVKQKTVIEELQSILEIPREGFKNQSHQGMVKYEGRWKDAGNWYYTVLFLLMWHASSSSTDQACHQLLLALADRYSALRFDAPYTDTTISLQGDVIECILATTRSKGPSISTEDCKDRQAAHDNIKKVLEGLRKCIWFIKDGEHFSVNDLPPTRAFVDLLQTTYCSNPNNACKTPE
jgi:hypothetical protein